MVAGPESLSSLSALLEQQPRSRLVPFVDQLVRPLTSPEVRGGSDLLTTLRSFLNHSGSLQATADADFLHVNTVRHRLGRVFQIVGRNPLLSSDQVDFSIAIWAHDRSLGAFDAGSAPVTQRRHRQASRRLGTRDRE